MTQLATFCGIAVFTLSISACGGGRDAGEAEGQDQLAPPSEAVGSTGTGPSNLAEQQDAERTIEALPGTASPLPLIGGVGALLLCTSMVLRSFRRRVGRTDQE